MMSTGNDFKIVEPTVLNLVQKAEPIGSLIVAVYATGEPPSFFSPMAREPEPPVNLPFDESFPDLYMHMLRLNPSLHDGAIMVRLTTGLEQAPVVTHWSCRLFPPPQHDQRRPNRGSAYNSAADFSYVPGVRAVYCASIQETLCITFGKERLLLG